MNRGNKRCRVVLATVLGVTIILLTGMKIYAVNSSYPVHKKIVYAQNTPAPLPVYTKEGNIELSKSSSLVVVDQDILNLDEVLKLAPQYNTSLVQSGQAYDMRVVIVSVLVKNTSDRETIPSLGQICLQRNACSNGIDQFLFFELNKEINLSQPLEPAEELTVSLPYCIYDVQFGFHDTWSRIDAQNFELVLAAYPEKVSIELGGKASK